MRLALALSLLVVSGCSSSSAPSVNGGVTHDGTGTSEGGVTQHDGGSTPDTGKSAPDTGSSPHDASLQDTAAVEAASPVDASVGKPGRMQSVLMTFYGWADNSPPGNAIAYPMNSGYPTVHDGAGGVGTYADPITYASDQAELAIGTLVYAPVIEKYLIMEDDCGQCDTDWSSSMTWHIDVWMNSDGTETANDLESCEDNWTQAATTIEIDPPPGRTVTTAPLFVPATNSCRTSP